MKKYLLLVIICMPGIFSFARQAVPGQHSLVTIAGDSAWVWLPPDHNLTHDGHRYPVVFYFPGLGTNSQEVLKQGVPRLIQSGWTATQQVPNGPKEKFIVISFTNPTGAYGPGLDFIIDSAFTKYKADTTRAYMVGASQGGTDLASYLLNSSSSYGAPSKAWILRRFKAAITLSMGNPNGQSNYSTLVPFRAKAWHAINDNITQHVFSESFINNLNQNNHKI